MDKYIRKEQALRIVYKAFEGTNYMEDAWAYCTQKLRALPPADVVKVVHGEWRYVGSNWECSNCLFPVYSKSKFYRYCPQCGARMDGGESK